MKYILGSSSVWRKQVMDELSKALQFGKYDILSPDIDEKAIRDPDPATMVKNIALAKTDALLPSLANTESILITSDQVISVNGVVREKPVDRPQCIEFLRSYTHFPAICHVGVCVTNTKTGKRTLRAVKAIQHFKTIDDSLIDRLLKNGDCMYCAGGFVCEQMEEYLDTLEGERQVVIGLPFQETLQMIKEVLKE